MNNALLYIKNTIHKLQLDLSDKFTEGDNRIAIYQSNSENPINLTVEANWRSWDVPTANNLPLAINTQLANAKVNGGDFVPYHIEVENISEKEVNSPMAIIGIPAGLSLQSWQLKEMEENRLFEYFEIIDNYLVAYFDTFQPGQKQKIQLDLKAEVPGHFISPASVAYPYYTAELKSWEKGQEILIEAK